MARKRRNRKSKGYLPGATWKDVIRGKPVTTEERARKRERNKALPPVQFKCRTCPEICTIRNRPGLLSKSYRCHACGGVLDPVVSEPVAA